MIRQTRFGWAPKTYQQPESRVSIFEPSLGLDGGQAPQELLPGFTPESRNFVHHGGYIEPRSGISRYDNSFSLGEPALWGMEAFTVEGLRHGIVASSGTIAHMPSTALNWTALTWVAASGAEGQGAASSIVIGWDGAAIYEPGLDETIAVFTNDKQMPKFAILRDSTTTYSDFTWVTSQFSRARSVCEADNRLVFFNVSSSAASLPQRVIWSARGNPLDYVFANGAGFEDLMDMRGVGQKVMPDGDSIVLFTDEQVWRGRVRRDAYAFDFYCVSREMGCPYPRTIAETPHGLVFLGRDLELYALNGDQLIPLGPTRAKGPDVGDHSRVQLRLQRTFDNGEVAWAAYNSAERRYELYFASTADETWPKHAVYYDFDNQSFFPQAFEHELTTGFEMREVDEALRWDSFDTSVTWDSYDVGWDETGLGVATKNMTVFSSRGTPYRFRSDQTSDDGTAIDCRWRSHGLGGADAFRYDQLYEVWAEYDSATTSNMSLFVSGNVGASFIEGSSRALSATSHNVQLFTCNITAQSPLFEIRVNDGSKPRISRFQARLRDGGLWGGS